MAIQYGLPQDMDLDENERRRRAMLAAGIFTGMPIEQIASTYATDRLNQAGQTLNQAQQFVDNPQQAIMNRLAPVAPNQAPIQVAGPAMLPTDVQRQPVAPVDLTQQQEAERRRQQQQQQQQMPVAQVPTPQQQMPVAQVPAGQQQMPNVATQPTLPQQPEWATQFQASRGDPLKLIQFASQESTPKDVRDLAVELVAQQNRGKLSMEDAEKKIQGMLTGDKAATSDVLRDIRKEEGSFVKALLFARLGLNDLAQAEQKKLQGDQRDYSQAILDGQQYFVERDNRGIIQRAWDSTGKRASTDIIPQLMAGALKPGVSAYGFTGEVGIAKDPTTGQDVEIRQRTNAQTGKIENVIVTGPNAGSVYKGTAIPQSKSVQTAMAKMDYGLITDLQKKHGGNVIDALSEFQKFKGPLNDVERQQFLNLYGYGKTVPGGTVPQTAVEQQPTPARTVMQGQFSPVEYPPVVERRPQQAQIPAPARPGVVAGPVAPVAPGARTALTTPIGEMQSQQRVREKAQTERIQTQEEAIRAEQKPPAEAKGKVAAADVTNQKIADDTYKLVQPIAELIKQSTGSGFGAGVDALAGTFGISPKGAQAIAQLQVLGTKLIQNVPRFEGPQSDRDTQLYRDAAGDVANAKLPRENRIAALKAIIELMKGYDKSGKNDWTYGQQRKPNVTTLPDGRTITKLD